MPKKELVGKVVSDKMQQTIVVAVENYRNHRKYEKQIVQTRKFKAHDAENSCKVGDRVRIQECPPISKDKHFTVVEILSRSTDVAHGTEG